MALPEFFYWRAVSWCVTPDVNPTQADSLDLVELILNLEETCKSQVPMFGFTLVIKLGAVLRLMLVCQILPY